MDSINIAFAEKPRYKLCTFCGITVTAVNIAKYHFDTRTGVNLIRLLMRQLSWTSRNEHKVVPKLQTATEQPLCFGGLILLHHRLEERSTCVWFGVAIHLAVEVLLGMRALKSHAESSLWNVNQYLGTCSTSQYYRTSRLRKIRAH